MEYLFSAGVVILFAGFIWFYIARPMLVDFGWIRDEDVNDIDNAAPVVMSRSNADEARTATDGRTDAATDGDLKECVALRLDRSKEGLLKVLVYNGWSTTDIRTVIKGANEQISAAVQAMKEEDDTLITPYAGRVTKRSFYPDDPDLEYKAP